MRCLPLLVAAVLGAGCDRPSATTPGGTTAAAAATAATSTPAPSEADRKAAAADMQQLALTLYLVHDDTGKSATGLADIEPKMGGAERLIQKIKDGRIVVKWGAWVEAKWWAYEKDAPDRGGYMIVPDPARNNEMRAKEVTAEEAKKILGR
jgi:hypothetical protein